MCFCGNSTYGVYGKANTCKKPCMGNKSQICGNIWANSIYLTSLGKYLLIVFENIDIEDIPIPLKSDDFLVGVGVNFSFILILITQNYFFPIKNNIPLFLDHLIYLLLFQYSIR